MEFSFQLKLDMGAITQIQLKGHVILLALDLDVEVMYELVSNRRFDRSLDDAAVINDAVNLLLE